MARKAEERWGFNMISHGQASAEVRREFIYMMCGMQTLVYWTIIGVSLLS